MACAAFSRGTLYRQIADTLGIIDQDEPFAALFPTRGQPAQAPARLALATVLQCAEGLSDRQAADAVRGRIDWMDVLCLELTNPGFDHTVLSEFRTRLLVGGAEQVLLDTLLMRLRARGLRKSRGRQRTDSMHILAAIRVLNWLERVGETFRVALNSLAVVAPAWLQAIAPSEWYARYSRRVENDALPKTEAARQELATMMGTDGQILLDAIDAATAHRWRPESPAVSTRRQVWAEPYVHGEGALTWRKVKAIPSPAELIVSPHDPEARYSTKRRVEWVGYQVHLTDTCEEDTPHLMVNVETTPATTPDDHMVAVIHASLVPQDVLPAEPLVDEGYTDSHVLVDSRRDNDVTIVGPVADDPSWQARAGQGFDTAQFLVDWDRQVVTCPVGKQSISWLPKALSTC